MLFTVAAEGALDLAVVDKVLQQTGHEILVAHNKGGHTKLDANLSGFANASNYSPWIVLRDMDRNQCPVTLRNDLLPDHGDFPGLYLRIVVREIEAWLLADSANLARFFGVAKANFPNDPEAEMRPKSVLLSLAQRSRNRNLREGLIPRRGSGATIGPEYNAILQKFVADNWDVRLAADNADSLRRFVAQLETL